MMPIGDPHDGLSHPTLTLIIDSDNLFCSGGQPLHTEQFVVPDRGPIWIDDINCIGNETSIFDCKHKPYGVSNCRHDEDVSVDCSLGMHYKNPSLRSAMAGRLYKLQSKHTSNSGFDQTFMPCSGYIVFAVEQ